MKTLFNTMIIISLLFVAVGVKAQDETKQKNNLQAKKKITVVKELEEFSSIEASSIFKIHVTQSDKQSVKVDAPENYMPLFKFEVKNGVLKLSLKDSIKGDLNDLFCHVTIRVKKLEKIKLSGASSLTAEGITSEKFHCNISGASSAVISVNSSTLTCDVSGASALHVSGNISGISDMDISGASVVYGYKLKSRAADCYVSGASKAELYAEESLRIEASGVCQVNYKGSAKVMAMASGMSSITKSE